MENDEELLKLAAKAAGIQIVGPVEKYVAQPNREHLGGFIVRNDRGGDSCWNPLGDDGDALRLAVTVGLKLPTFCVCVMDDFTATYSFNSDIRGDTSHMTDPYAATRRAIVHAAASLVKG